MEKDRILGLEALIRWNYSAKRVMFPFKFISIVEESSLIIRMDEWVINQVLKQRKNWLDQGLTIVFITVDIFGRHLASDFLAPCILKTLKFYGIDGRLLEIEITEEGLIARYQALH